MAPKNENGELGEALENENQNSQPENPLQDGGSQEQDGGSGEEGEGDSQSSADVQQKKIEYIDSLLNEEHPIIDEFSDLFYESMKKEINGDSASEKEASADAVKQDAPQQSVPVQQTVPVQEPVKQESASEEIKKEEPVKESVSSEEVKKEEPVKEESSSEEIKKEEPVKEEASSAEAGKEDSAEILQPEDSVPETLPVSEKEEVPAPEEEVSEPDPYEDYVPEEDEEPVADVPSTSSTVNGKNGKKDGGGDPNRGAAAKKPEIDFSQRPSFFENILLFLGLASPELKRKNSAYKEMMRKVYDQEKKAENEQKKAEEAAKKEEEKKQNEKDDVIREKLGVEKDDSKKHNKNKTFRENISEQIKKEMAKLDKYPKGSMMALSIQENITHLSELHAMMLDEKTPAAQLKQGMEKVFGGLVVENMMEESSKKSEVTREMYNTVPKNGKEYTAAYNELCVNPAIRGAMEGDPIKTVGDMLTKKTVLMKYTAEASKNMYSFAQKGSKIVDENTFGAIQKNPVTGRWEKMKGVDESAVTASLNSLAAVKDETKLYRTAAEMTRVTVPPEKQQQAIADRIAETDKILKEKADDKAVCAVAEIAKKNLIELQKNGMPQKGSENYEEQKRAYKDVAGSLFALEHIMGPKNENSKAKIAENPAKAQDYVNMHMKKGILTGMARSYGDTFEQTVISHQIEERSLYKNIRDEARLRKKCEIPENAECYGGLFRTSPHEKWQVTKGAPESYVNESYLDLLKEKPLTKEEMTKHRNIFRNAPEAPVKKQPEAPAKKEPEAPDKQKISSQQPLMQGALQV